MDICRWGLGKTVLPASVSASGGKYIYDDDQETPNTELATFDYGDCELQFEVRGLLTGAEAGMPPEPGSMNCIGNIFFGSKGFMTVDYRDFRIYLGEKRELAQQVKYTEPKEWDTAPHMRNFLKAVRSRNYKDLTCHISEGHLSAALCHLANISYRTGRKLKFDPATETFPGDHEANQYLKRKYRPPFVIRKRSDSAR